MNAEREFESNWKRWLDLIGHREPGKLPDFERLVRQLDVNKVLREAPFVVNKLSSLDATTLWGALCLVRALAKREKAGRFCEAVAQVATNTPDHQMQELAVDILVSAKKKHRVVAQVLESWFVAAIDNRENVSENTAFRWQRAISMVASLSWEPLFPLMFHVFHHSGVWRSLRRGKSLPFNAPEVIVKGLGDSYMKHLSLLDGWLTSQVKGKQALAAALLDGLYYVLHHQHAVHFAPHVEHMLAMVRSGLEDLYDEENRRVVENGCAGLGALLNKDKLWEALAADTQRNLIETLLDVLGCSYYWARCEAAKALLAARGYDWPEGCEQQILVVLKDVLGRRIPTEDEGDNFFKALLELIRAMKSCKKEMSSFSAPLYEAFQDAAPLRLKEIGEALALLDPENVAGRILPKATPLGPVPLSTCLEFLPRGQRLESVIFSLVRETRGALSQQLSDHTALIKVESSLIEDFLQAAEAGHKITSYIAPESLDLLLPLIRHRNKRFAIRALKLVNEEAWRDERKAQVRQVFLEYLGWDGQIYEVVTEMRKGWPRIFREYPPELAGSWFVRDDE